MTIATSGEIRLKLLRLLAKAGEMPLNNALLATGLQSTGLRISAEVVAGELAALADLRCVTLTQVAHLVVAELSDRGMDVAKGLSAIPGIDRHIPGAGL